MQENENKYLSLKTAAGLYGYTRDHLGLMIRQGKLKGLKLGSYYVTTNEWMADYFKKYTNPGHSATAGKFSNKFLTQALAAKDPAVAGCGSAKEKEAENKTPQASVQKKFEDNSFSIIQKKLSSSLQEITLAERELSAVREKTNDLSVLSAQHYATLGNQYLILPIRKMQESEREEILNKIADCDELKNDRETVRAA